MKQAYRLSQIALVVLYIAFFSAIAFCKVLLVLNYWSFVIVVLAIKYRDVTTLSLLYRLAVFYFFFSCQEWNNHHCITTRTVIHRGYFLPTFRVSAVYFCAHNNNSFFITLYPLCSNLQVVKLSIQNSLPSEYTRMVLLQTSLDKIDPAQQVDFFFPTKLIFL